jgi:hypothetical protein
MSQPIATTLFAKAISSLVNNRGTPRDKSMPSSSMTATTLSLIRDAGSCPRIERQRDAAMWPLSTPRRSDYDRYFAGTRKPPLACVCHSRLAQFE